MNTVPDGVNRSGELRQLAHEGGDGRDNMLWDPGAIAADGLGNVYVLAGQPVGGRTAAFRVSHEGEVTLLAGPEGDGYLGVQVAADGRVYTRVEHVYEPIAGQHLPNFPGRERRRQPAGEMARVSGPG